MANSARRALANTTVADSLSYSSLFPVHQCHQFALCKQFQNFMHFTDSFDLPVRYSGSHFCGYLECWIKIYHSMWWLKPQLKTSSNCIHLTISSPTVCGMFRNDVLLDTHQWLMWREGKNFLSSHSVLCIGEKVKSQPSCDLTQKVYCNKLLSNGT